MAMRSQFYEWSAQAGTNNTVILGQQFSIFTGGIGNGIPNPANTSANQFIVVDNFGCTPSAMILGSADGGGITGGDVFRGQPTYNSIAGPRAYLQFRINTTDYFADPDGVTRDGIPGSYAPYPASVFFEPCRKKQKPVYILPGQTWDVLVVAYNSITNGASSTIVNPTLKAFIKYTLYDGPDAIIATRLVEQGIKVSPKNVDWYKQNLIARAPTESPPDMK
jgi:hypothetical protein